MVFLGDSNRTASPGGAVAARDRANRQERFLLTDKHGGEARKPGSRPITLPAVQEGAEEAVPNVEILSEIVAKAGMVQVVVGHRVEVFEQPMLL